MLRFFYEIKHRNIMNFTYCVLHATDEHAIKYLEKACDNNVINGDLFMNP